MMTKKCILVSLTIFLWIFTTGCVQYIARYDGPYEGKIIDAETRVPIEGVVVLGVWNNEAPTVAGAVSSYYDARETITDAKGDFKVPGKGLKILSDVGVMNVLIFKAGYEYIGLGTWEAFKEDSSFKVRWEGEKAIIPLRKLTMDQRRKEGMSPPLPPGEAPIEKVRLMLKEINKNAVEIGADIIDTWNGGTVYEKTIR